MVLFLFEPDRPQGQAEQKPAAAQAASDTDRFPYATALAVGSLTLFASILYYVFIVNGSLVWREIGVTDPMAISKATVVPSYFILAGTVLFRLASRHSNAMQIAIFLGLLGLGLSGVGLAHHALATELALIVQQTGAGMAVPALIAWAQSKFDFRHRGRGMGVWTSAFFLGQAISPIVVGTIAQAAGSMHAAFFITGLTACLAALGGAIMALRPRRAPKPLPV